MAGAQAAPIPSEFYYNSRMIFYKALNFNCCHFTEEILKAGMAVIELIKMTSDCLLCATWKRFLSKMLNIFVSLSKEAACSFTLWF